jgi:predicted dehydrogenase
MTTNQPALRFSVIGVNHFHIYGQVNSLIDAGAEFVAAYNKEPDTLANFIKYYPGVKIVETLQEILEDESIQLVVSAAIYSERASIGIAAMQHGKDFMSDKPGFTTLEQLAAVRKVQAETGRIYSICFSERFQSPATVKAGELVAQGRIGRVIQTLGIGPHRTNIKSRPYWFFKKEYIGGILADIGSHQCDQFLFFTGSTSAKIVAASVANYKHPQFPTFEDFGQLVLQGDSGNGYVRVDWYNPDGLATWGDGRLFILGTEGYIEARKYIDVAGRSGTDHLFVVDQKGTEYIDCSAVPLPYGGQLIYDVLNRTETAMSQAHCFLASELALQAEAQAVRLS